MLTAKYYVLALFSAPLLITILSGCEGMTEPTDVAIAQELCEKHGGYTQVHRYERGRNVIINCKDELHIDVRFPKAK